MNGPTREPPATVTARVTLGVGAYRLQAEMTVPTAPVSLRQALPVIQPLADGLVDLAARQAEDSGQRISCQAGCGACCRQLVPVSEVEARRVSEVIGEMPEPRRAEVRRRFAEARRRLDEAGLLERLERRAEWPADAARDVGLEYFRLGIACPFLENESCSIYADRPITCREYLVTSPAENCARPTADGIRLVPLASKVWAAVARFDPTPPGARYLRWVPLILAPSWVEAHPEEPVLRPGPEWLRELIGRLSGQQAPEAEPLAPEVAASPPG
jgi:Fe-S-cluster containining protein